MLRVLDHFGLTDQSTPFSLFKGFEPYPTFYVRVFKHFETTFFIRGRILMGKWPGSALEATTFLFKGFTCYIKGFQDLVDLDQNPATFFV